MPWAVPHGIHLVLSARSHPLIDSICTECFTGKDAKRNSGCDGLMMSALGGEVGNFRIESYFGGQG